MTEILITNTYCPIINLTDSDVHEHLDSVLSFYVQGYQYTKAYRSGWWDAKKQKWEKWDGKNHLLRKGLKFHKGLLPKVQAVLKSNGIKLTFSLFHIRLAERKEV